ncbi:hypothetical protein [Streptomyces sp. NRRL S-1022]|uniref:hypothetical protein n=1 Tax=Streptomyces sp. NRRL S-1022 TaxID=1463880 RepID=UPI000AFA9C24|nr:hypothetical protein [Streptomyces sp. NRRL S-1022]
MDEFSRDVRSIRLPRWGYVAANSGVVPWLVFAEEGRAVEPVRRYLIDFVARYNRPGNVRSYAFDLLRWWRWLRVVDVPWNQATPAEGRDFALWLGATVKVPNAARTVSSATAGTIKPITKKPYLDDRYKPRTIRHSNAVIRSFYTFWIETGEGPLINPVPLARSERRRPHAHRNPLHPYRGEGRLRYNPKVPRRRPRQMSDERWNELFAALRSNRDRAIVALAISNGARASELLGMKGDFLDRRRADRPQEEYREPTEQEWHDFQQHFELRKVSLGTCGRPYGTPCKHEHAPLTERSTLILAPEWAVTVV